jgi:hypothetical protein
VEAFVSYAREDERQLAGLQRDGLVSLWNDALILPGTNFGDEIMAHLESAEVIILLVSADFIASEFIWDVELPAAMARQQAGEAVVVPIIVRPCLWTDSELGSLEALPSGGTPVTSWDDTDAAWLDVAMGLKRLLHRGSPEGSSGEG